MCAEEFARERKGLEHFLLFLFGQTLGATLDACEELFKARNSCPVFFRIATACCRDLEFPVKSSNRDELAFHWPERLTALPAAERLPARNTPVVGEAHAAVPAAGGNSATAGATG